MIGEGDPLQNTDGPSKLDQAKEAVQAATQTVKETTQSVADAIEAGRRPGAPLDRLARWAREAPLHAVTVAFLVGVAGRRPPQVMRFSVFAPSVFNSYVRKEIPS